jgi:branched-chain amino acid transport system permease protein
MRDFLPLLLACGVGLLAIGWIGSNGYREDLVSLACTYALIALGMYVPFVLAGSLSMAYSAYAGVGGYAVGLVATKSGWPLPYAWVIAAVLSAALAVVLGFATRRLSGFYLAAVTLLFGLAFERWLLDADSITSGAVGISAIRDTTIFGIHLSRSAQVRLAIVFVIVLAFLLDRLRRSPFGLAVRAMRDVPVAVESTGVRVPVLELVALGIGAAIASWGGALFASFVRGVNPETFTLNIVFLAIFMPLLGGVGTSWGAVVGAMIVVELTLNAPAFSRSGQLVLSLGVLVVLLIAPRGVLGYIDAARRRLVALADRPRGATGGR